MTRPPLSIVVLAAGEGKRMRSDLPKVLHPVAGQPMLARVLDVAARLEPAATHVVYGHRGDAVRSALGERPIHWVHQAEQLGTGHAVAQALPAVPDDHQVLVLCGDVPLIRAETLQQLLEAAGQAVGLLTVTLANPTGYGRVLRDACDGARGTCDGGRDACDGARGTCDGAREASAGAGVAGPAGSPGTVPGMVAGIVEEKDASAEQRAIREVNTGVMCLPAGALRGWLADLDAGNAQGEYYLTDCIARARQDGVSVHPVACHDPWEVQGVNDRAQLAGVERACQRRQAEALMCEQGLGLADPNRFDLRGILTVGRDCFIDTNVIIEGHVVLGDGVRIGPFTRVVDSHVEAGATIQAHCEIVDSHVGRDCQVGPFARLRPGTRLGAAARVGNFVETKQAEVGPGSKINHLSYIGDAQLGANVNVGAGTITCNYDGRHKHQTVIGSDSFVGSNTALVAPVSVGAGVTIGAGTTVRGDIPDDTLAIESGQARKIPGWRPDWANNDRE